MSIRFPYSPSRTPPIPAVVLTVSNTDGSRSVASVSAHLDTAADRTGVPAWLVAQLGLISSRQLTAQGFGGVAYSLPVYEIVLDIPGVANVRAYPLGHSNEPFVLIGRDVLNHFRVTFDGPNEVAEFH